MEFTQLGRTGLKVSRLCLGTMNFGPQTNEEDSFAIMDKALELGINFFDTANVYGWKLGEGTTENIVGRWFAQGGGRREKTVIATKVFGRMGEWPNQSRLSALHIREACEASLKRMQTDHIDLYQMHHVDRNSPWEEIWQAMDVLVQQGKVLYVGSSNFAGWQIAKAQDAAKARPFMGLVCEQSLYSLNDRMIELEVIPASKDYGLGLIPWSPLSGGLLGGVTDAQLTDTNQYLLFPNIHYDFHGANRLTIFRYRPHHADPQRCYFDIFDLARPTMVPTAGPRPPHVVTSTEALPLTIRQDAELLVTLQQRMRSGAYPGHLLHEHEGRLLSMHRTIDEFLARSPT